MSQGSRPDRRASGTRSPGRASARQPFVEEKPDDPKQEGRAAGDPQDESVAYAILAGARIIYRAQYSYLFEDCGKAGSVGNGGAGDELLERFGKIVGGIVLAVNLAIDAPIGVNHADLQQVVETRCGGDKAEFDTWNKGLSELSKQSIKAKAEKTLKIEIDDDAFDRLYGHISHPIETKKGQKIAVRVISQFGEETTKVIAI